MRIDVHRDATWLHPIRERTVPCARLDQEHPHGVEVIADGCETGSRDNRICLILVVATSGLEIVVGY